MGEKDVKKESGEMLVSEEEPERRYAYVPKVIFRDLNLNMKERGYLSILYGLPEDTEFSLEMMTKYISDGIGEIKRIFWNLVAKGYVIPIWSRDENDRFVFKDLVLTIPDDANIVYLDGEDEEQFQEPNTIV